MPKQYHKYDCLLNMNSIINVIRHDEGRAFILCNYRIWCCYQ